MTAISDESGAEPRATGGLAANSGHQGVFNAFNSDNFYNYQASLQSSQVGKPQSEFPKRTQ
jgi:hypothetical protein